jgi:hypothetical protein
VALVVVAAEDEDVVVDEGDVFSFSFPRLVADENARKKLWDSFDSAGAAREGPVLLGEGCPGRELGKFMLAGWKVVRDL